MEGSLIKITASYLDAGLQFSPLAILFVLQDFIKETKGLFPSNISLNGVSAPWYMPLSQFETVFLCLVMFKIFVLRYVEILPININNWFHGDPSGRRKRSMAEAYTQASAATKCYDSKKDEVTELMIGLLTRIDEEECFLRSLCFMASEGNDGNNFLKIPPDIRMIILVLKKLAKIPDALNSHCSETIVSSNNITQFFAVKKIKEAVRIGGLENITCEERYNRCTLSKNDTIHYLNLIFELQ